MKVQNLKALEAEMRAVARGEQAAPSDASLPSIDSAQGLIRLLTPENRILLKIIRDEKPQSIAALARLTHRAEPNLLRTLNKLQAFGLLEIDIVKRRRVPKTTIGTLYLSIDPYTMSDTIQMKPLVS